MKEIGTRTAVYMREMHDHGNSLCERGSWRAVCERGGMGSILCNSGGHGEPSVTKVVMGSSLCN